jgi:hypothetical protein
MLKGKAVPGKAVSCIDWLGLRPDLDPNPVVIVMNNE